MMRVKSHWFKGGRERTPQELAGAAAFIAWRIAENALKTMRRADFEIAAGPQYFAFFAEFLIFLVQVADRIAYRRLDAQARVAFTTALANRAGEILADNRSELLGGAAGAIKAGFIDLLNRRAEEYAAFGYGESGADFAFLRHLGRVMEEVADQRDKRWVMDRAMAVEAPEAAATLEKAMQGLLETEPGPRRASGAVGGD